MFQGDLGSVTDWTIEFWFKPDGEIKDENLSHSDEINTNYGIQETTISNGTGGGNWNNASSWEGGVVPSSSDNVTIMDGDVITIPNFYTATCNQLIIESNASLVNGYSLSVSGNITNNGTITNSHPNGLNADAGVNLNNNGTLHSTINTAIDADITILNNSGGTISFTGPNSGQSININRSVTNAFGANITAKEGTIRFNSTLSNFGTLTAEDGGSIGIYSSQTVDLSNTDIQSGGVLTIGNNMTVNAQGSPVSNNGSINILSGAALNWTGSSTQVIKGSGSITKIQLNNANNLEITGEQSVSQRVEFTAGKIILSGSGDLIFTTLSGFTGADSDQYVVTSSTGRVVRTVVFAGTEFPVGPNTSSYNPVTFQGQNTATYGVNVQVGLSNSYGTGYVDREWDLDHISGNSPNVNVTLQWNGNEESNGFDRTDCRISHLNGSSWDYFESGAASGSDPYTRTASGVTSFSPFTVTSDATLATQWISFDAELLISGQVLLEWVLEDFEETDEFVVFRSADARSWKEIAVSKLEEQARNSGHYQMTDNDPLNGYNYYMVEAYDRDGPVYRSDIRSVKTTGNGSVIYPNPARDQLIWESGSESASIPRIMDAFGREWSERVRFNKMDKQSWTVDISQLAPDLYYLSANETSLSFVKK